MKSLKPKIVDDLTEKETYANKLVGTSFDGGAITITLGVTRVTPERIDDPPRSGEDPVVAVTARPTISPSCAIELVNALNQMLGVIAMHSNQQKPGHTPSQQTH